MAILVLAAVLVIFLTLAFFRASLASWLLAIVLVVPVLAIQSRISDSALQAIYLALLLFIALLAIPALRRNIVSHLALKFFRKTLPPVSSTEQEALQAGTVWWDAELFSGQPGWNRLLALPKYGLSTAEQAFLDNEVEQLCAMLDDWDITQRRADLPPEVWQFMKIKGFFGMIIPKHYGGLEFSAQAHSAVLCKIATRSGTAALTVMAPNSLGPARLLLRYGSAEQKEKYLRHLAYGLEVPCFALPGQLGASDANAICDHGQVCYGKFEGRQNVLGVRLTWESRQVTLAPVATLLGIAFRLRDPEHLLGGAVERGITLALVPACLPGVSASRRHLLMNSALLSGTTQGRDVFIPMDYLIGGQARIGQGWRMLMECLAAAHSISLPANSSGGMQLAARASGAYALLRGQLHGKFAGVEEALARIGAHTYMMDAARQLTALAADLGENPPTISAIIKCQASKSARSVIDDAMDIHGGKGICLGPENYLARIYQQAPLAIAVEGANMLARSTDIFVHGVMRSHPYVAKEIAAARDSDQRRALYQFDAAMFGHLGYTLCNAARSLVFGLCDGRGIRVPQGRETRRYYQQLTRYSAAFALGADAAMAICGSSLKRHETISARLGEVLSMLYFGAAALKRFEDDGRPAADLPLLHYSMQDALYQAQQALHGAMRNLPNAPARWLLGALIFPLGLRLARPNGHLAREIAALLMRPGAPRDRLTAGIYLPGGHGENAAPDNETSHACAPSPTLPRRERVQTYRCAMPHANEEDALYTLEAALASTLACEPLLAKLEDARKAGKLCAPEELPRIAEALEQGMITAQQAQQLQRDYALRRKALMVDDFAADELRAG